MSVLRKLGRILMGLMRELSDETAYKRHLKVHARRHSGEEWRRFHEHRLQRRYQGAKCC